ncbi:MAG TPA: tRNA (adenosine(37)-N6)-threonylcarbamoyltransferase complex ATPase subunit type 1 TsaE [Steroidobacteraceae bacterium]|nr:tRNA (adenosine(37)-N6)-threonylcarbamoyltransferase complex ATPase subunit type 1 TsaE [Steroidobacteraceae bacterium]
MREPDQLSAALADEAATRAAGAALARALDSAGADSVLVTLAGELGTGKTTLARGFLEALGVRGPVRSPSYPLVESYRAGARTVHHCDWYRLSAAQELEGLGFRELVGAGQWILIEWPERAPAVAARADLALNLTYAPAGRDLVVSAGSPTGRQVVARLKTDKALG